MIGKIFKYIKENESIEFIDNFFGIKPTQKDFKRIEKFKEVLKLKFIGKLTIEEISKTTGINRWTVSLWIKLRQLPFITQMLKVYLRLGEPKPDWKWLPINVGFGQTLDGPWVQVPMGIQEFNCIIDVISQVKPLPDSIERIKKFFDVNDEERLKLEIFAYVLGFMVGDFGKRKIKKNRRISSRDVSLKLSKKVVRNFLLGEFVKECVRGLGVEMKRYKDQVDKSTNAERFYWESKHSLFFEWVFKVCLGLREGETTTFNPVRMKWLLKTPKFFHVRFIQGLGDSDGSINMQSGCCTIYSYPNTNFIEKLITQFGVKVRTDNTYDGPVVALTPKEAIKLPLFFPNERLSHRYYDLKAYVEANRIKPGGRTTWSIRKLIRKYSKQGRTKADTMKTLVHKHKLAVSYVTLSRYYEQSKN